MKESEGEMRVDEPGILDAARPQAQDMTMGVAELSVQEVAKPRTLSVAEYQTTETSQMSEEITCRVPNQPAKYFPEPLGRNFAKLGLSVNEL